MLRAASCLSSHRNELDKGDARRSISSIMMGRFHEDTVFATPPWALPLGFHGTGKGYLDPLVLHGFSVPSTSIAQDTYHMPGCI